MEETEWLLREKYNGHESEAFAADVKRLETGEPLAYVIGFVPFLNTKIYLDSKPLIPRPETEYWVEKAIADIRKHTNDERPVSVIHVLDLCAGSGCIGVAVAKAISDVSVDFAELEEKHHSTILKNCRMDGIDVSRVRIFGGNLFEQLSDRKDRSEKDGYDTDRSVLSEKYDYILSNPPYIDPALDRTEESVKNFEPREALYGGENGMELIQRIITEAPIHLTETGTLYLEHEPEQRAAIQILAKHNGFDVQTEKDQYGLERYSILKQAL